MRSCDGVNVGAEEGKIHHDVEELEQGIQLELWPEWRWDRP